FIIEDLEMSRKQMVSFFGEEKTENTWSDISANKLRKATFLVKEVWTNEMVVWKAGAKILKKEKNQNYDFEDDDKNFFAEPKKPYVIKSLFETEDSIIGETDYVQQVLPIQDNINKRKRQIENIVAKVSNPILLIDDQVMSEERASSITNEEGLILYGKDAANGTKVRFESPGQAPAQLFEDVESSRREFDNIWGTHSTTRGEREGRETLGGRQLLKAADLGRIDLVARQLERSLDEVAEYWTQLIKMFYDEDKTFSILGEDGVRFIKNFSGKKIGKGVKPQVVTGSTLPKDEMFIHEEARLLWQLKGIGVKTFYKMLKLPNINEAIEDYVQTQSGAIFQQQGGGQPLNVPGQEQGGQPIQ
ncbi:MAG: hypothetical protein U1C72_01560, partial [Candidatus Pacearchaeota archaeon]|nr:hypothetical protein [Candidatus Pacearchaeota archaeon]